MSLVIHEPPIEWCPSAVLWLVTRENGAIEVESSGSRLGACPRALRIYGNYLILRRIGYETCLSLAARAKPAHLLVLRRSREPWLLIARLDGPVRSDKAVRVLEAYVPEEKRIPRRKL